MHSKTCRKCGCTKPVVEFWKDRASPDGLWSRCKGCGRRQNRKTYRENKDRELARNQIWRDRNKAGISLRKRRRRSERVRWVVYRLNFHDGCFYIGSTNDLDMRLSLHRWEMRHGVHRNGEIRCRGFGPDDFDVDVVEEVESEGEARIAEGRMISELIGDPMCMNQQRVIAAEIQIHS